MAGKSPTSPPKRPRLSLQIKALSGSPDCRASRALAAAVDVKDQATFNTLSNAYAAAIERSAPTQEHPASNNSFAANRPSLLIQTHNLASRTQPARLPSPYPGPYLETPLLAQPSSPSNMSARNLGFPSVTTPKSPLTTTTATTKPPLPYTHPRSLRSILRNSPLTRTPNGPGQHGHQGDGADNSRRQSRRLAEKAARRVAYHSPLCQTITTSLYTQSHIDLLLASAGACGTPPASSCADEVLQLKPNDRRDGGQTPGPMEEMRRRVAAMEAGSTTLQAGPGPSSQRKRSASAGLAHRDKKRRWVWTIGEDAEDGGIGS